MMKRGLRRQQRNRMVARAFRRYRPWMRDEAQAMEFARKNADHLQKCSCAGCGNPRRHFGIRTVQERRALMSVEEKRDEG